ncbi:MAG: hypothetical protein IT260_10815 [Saprospiraceae bacterium]|nr:hypothetical protein [Saprospiraceae bacterium]
MTVFTTFRSILLGFVFLLGLLACHKPASTDPDVVVTLDPEFEVDLFEQRDASTGAATFGLWVESTQLFACENYSIEAQAEVSASAVSVRLLSIRKPDTCQGEADRARGFVAIGPLADGEYPFVFSLNNAIVNEGTLRVQQGHYELDLPLPKAVDFKNRVLESIPDSLIWGFVSVPSETDVPVANQFFGKLKTISIEHQLTPGYYGYFTVAGTGQLYWHSSMSPPAKNLPFLRQLTGSTDELRALLQGYRADPGHPLQIKCLTGLGAF